MKETFYGGRVKDACQRYNISRGTLMKWAESAGAISWIGRTVIIDFTKMDEFIRNNNGNRPLKRKEQVPV